ncbi:MAG: CotH kinase family protein [Cyclobacteriaceae bacterium]
MKSSKTQISIIFLVLLKFISIDAMAQVDHWESVILEGDDFKYKVPNSEISNWYNEGFDDNLWEVGSSGFGYGDNDDATILETTNVVYLRKSFNIVEIGDIDMVVFDMDFDDGFVAYINGVEISRFLVSGDQPAFDQLADGLHEANLYRGIDPERFIISKEVLRAGQNILAIAVHNESLTSSDLTAIPTLSFGILSQNEFYRPVPAWFDIPNVSSFKSSNLPIVIIETDNGSDILNDPRITATMWILDRNDGNRNLLEDQNNPDFQDYKGKIDIEIRGSSSQDLPKKQFGFTTYNNGGLKDNVSLLGMPRENDWILNGLAFDPSLIRDYLSYNLYRQMGNYTTRTQFCEVLINGNYNGLYVLQEKLKADNNRIDVNQIELADNSFPEITGGYVIKADKPNNDPVAFAMPNYSGWWTEYIHDTPEPELATFQQTNYMKNLFNSLAEVAGNNDFSITTGSPSIIDVPSFIDYMLINELAANVDAYQFSTYFHKDRNGKLRAGPIWDCNLTFGNDLFDLGFDRSKTSGWQFFDGDNVGSKFWKDLFDNNTYRCYLSRRWYSLIEPGQPLSKNNIEGFITETKSQISEAIGREEVRWGAIGDHDAHIQELQNFISQRTNWMSSQLGSFETCADITTPSLTITAINYHPEDVEDLDDSDLEFIRITNTGSQIIDLAGIYFGGTGLVYQFPNNAKLNAGQHLYLANDIQTFTEFYNFSPFDEFSRSLDNGGQAVELLDAFGNQIDIVAYDDNSPWPEQADGDGGYLELIDFNADNNVPANWKSTIFGIETLLSSEVKEPWLRIYPNPAVESLLVNSDDLIHEIVLFDNQGRFLKSIEVDQKFQKLDFSNLKAGIYHLKIVLPHGEVFRKVIRE